MYEMAGDFTNKYFNYADPIHIHILGSTTLRFFRIVPPASSYIIIPPDGIITYGPAGGTILK